MASSASELSQEYKQLPHSYSMLLNSFGDQPDQQTQKLEEFLARLEKEWLKIEAFKRELPLCMQLLTNAMEASKQQLQNHRANQGPRLEEFIPLKHSSSEGSDQKASNMSEKASWMVSAQLWSQSSDGSSKLQTPGMSSPKKECDHQNSLGVSPQLALDDKIRNGVGGGAFLPFSKEKNACTATTSPPLRVLPDLALASTDNKEMEDKKCHESDNSMPCSRRENYNKSSSNGEEGKTGANQAETQTTTTNTQTHRKARRCWSPDLHRRFVNALQMLGGSQVATPKQIRELMKVDGLTNDEVKSHLQKYRLHTRRPSPSPQVAGAPAPQLLVLGSIWVPPEYATAAAGHSTGPSIYGAHPASLASTHYCAPPVPQEFYPVPTHHQLHRPMHHVYKTSSHTHSSPESEVRGAGDRSESIEDGKSESGSWKGESCENIGVERRGGLAYLRNELVEKGNGSEITLKF